MNKRKKKYKKQILQIQNKYQIKNNKNNNKKSNNNKIII